MSLTPTPIPFPLAGVHLGTAHSAQPAGTTPSAQNVRGFDPRTKRFRGGQRAGLSKYNSNRVGTSPITDGVALTQTAALTTYSLRATPTVEWTLAVPARRTVICSAMDARTGNLYVGCVDSGLSTGINYLAKINPEGVLLWSYPVPLPNNSVLIKSVRVDEDGAIYVCLSGGPGANILRYEETGNSYILKKTWELTPPNNSGFVDCAVRGGVLYAIENAQTGAGPPKTFSSYLHQYQGIGTFEPSRVWSAEIAQYNDTPGNDLVAICVAITPDGAAVVGFADETDPPNANGAISKFGPNPPTGGPPVTPVWTVNATGVGQAVVCGENGEIWTQGYGAENVRKYIDAGSSVSASWNRTTAATNFKGAQSLAVDRQGNVYQAVTNGTNTRLVRIVADGSATTWTADNSVIPGACYTVVTDPFDIDAGTKCPYVYVGTAHSTGSVQKLSLYSVTQADGSTRSMVNVVACGGDIKYFGSTGSVTTPAAGTGALINSTQFGMLFAIGGSAYAIDGKNNLVITPGAFNSVAAWTATSGGEVPKRCRLGCAWNSRAVLAGKQDEPSNFFMSAVGDPLDWDFFPTPQTSTQALAGNYSSCGQCPDVINALVPYSDDLLIFGCDHTIYRLTGDPAAGGQFDLVSDITGMAWGKAWCKDQSGTLYFFGSRGGVYQMIPGGKPELISQAVDEELMAVDLAANRVRLVYDDRNQSLHVFITPFSAGATTHYCMEIPQKAWWKDVFGSTSLDPFCVWIADGDSEADRAVVLGCRDGYARKIDIDANRDDGTDIASFVALGPIMDPTGTIEVKLTDLRCVLPANSSSIDYTAQVSDSPEYTSLTVAHSGTWGPGRNDAVWERARGTAVWIKLSSRSGAQTWAFEKLTGGVLPAGRTRNR